MTKEEWIDALDSAYMKAKLDYNSAGRSTPEEYMAQLCMHIFDYLSDAIKEL